MTKAQEIRVPDIGDFSEVEIVEVMVKVGDTVAAEDSLITLETDKAAMDVPAPTAGRIVSLEVSAGDKVSEGSLILLLEPAEAQADADDKAAEPKSEKASAAVNSGRELAKPQAATEAAPDTAKPEAARQEQQAAAAPKGILPPVNEAGFAKAHASPAIRKFARELGVDLGRVKGTGNKNRIVRDDVTAFVKAALAGGSGGGGSALPALPQVNFRKFGTFEERPLERIQKISGPRLHASWLNIPHITQQDEADITDMEAQRQALKAEAAKRDVKLTPLAFIIRACVRALQEYSVFNTSMGPDATTLIWKKYMHIGFAADTPKGLVVPVIRNADQKNLWMIAAELADLSSRAREGKLKPDEMQGGSFTVSSLGGIGGTFFTPIINPPEVAILGVGRAKMQPVWQDKKFVPRLILPLSLSYDHRVIDGATGVRFTGCLAARLADADNLVEL